MQSLWDWLKSRPQIWVMTISLELFRRELSALSVSDNADYAVYRMKLRIVVVASAALLLALALTQLSRRRQANAPPTAPPASEVVSMPEAPEPELPPQVSLLTPAAASPAAVVSNSPSASATNWLQRLLSEDGESLKLPREDIDRWLASGRTNAEDLLAARQAGGGLEFLRMALTNFPDDPRVLFAASALDDGPEARRERLDRFKAAAPDNALADYLSAREHLKNAQPEQAQADLLAASGKTGFQDYTLDAIQNAEDLFLQSGKSPAEAKAMASSSVLLPHLAQLKGLAQEMAILQRQYLAGGDAASAENLAALGLQLGQRLGTGEASHTLISQLVGIAVERIVLNPLDAERSYDFLGASAREHIDQLTARRAAVRQDTQLFDAWMRQATDADIVSYFDRFKIYGESSAMAWIRQRQGAR